VARAAKHGRDVGRVGSCPCQRGAEVDYVATGGDDAIRDAAVRGAHDDEHGIRRGAEQGARVPDFENATRRLGTPSPRISDS
jgi:hypothetical protein